MLAFAIWNTVDKSFIYLQETFLASNQCITQKLETIWCMALKSKVFLQFPGFEKKFNYDTLNNYLSFQYAVPPQTFFENLYCLLPGHYLWYKNGKITTTRYWEAMFEPAERYDRSTSC